MFCVYDVVVVSFLKNYCHDITTTQLYYFFITYHVITHQHKKKKNFVSNFEKTEKKNDVECDILPHSFVDCLIITSD